ncbi:DUF1343 domain-containing protein [Spirosoma aureum]|uniref:DUF1343 domain-containing protein n=1 Tax=Spirosoma aureum TaxID=2692134 RepID=A0A6G9AJ00_9BACT|nr:DUF1343 domain-containing protein [Spirosoma aureum]QIP12430.1 DUF1343 domain-containing protein [Spirosoma aureum]
MGQRFFKLLAITAFLLIPFNLIAQNLRLGCEQTGEYLPDLLGKKVALVVNHTSIFSNHRHLVDSLLSLGVTITMIFTPEHGYRGVASPLEKVDNSIDARTGLPITSLYGANTKPTTEQLKDVDVVVFDIQDIGVRYFTFSSTMHYIMEACAETDKPLIILDRPNPNGHYVAGPVLNRKFASFVGLNPVPIVYGLTVGELARMINSEGWLASGKPCTLKVVACQNYTHQMPYDLPVPPTPNLPNRKAILMYASLCLFEGTEINFGRGTDTQFQVIGGTSPNYGQYMFTPIDRPGALNPANEGQLCYGLDLRRVNAQKVGFTLKYLIDFYQKAPDKTKFFIRPAAFDKLAGNDFVRIMITDGKSEKAIRAAWKKELNQFKVLREKYLLYP